MKAQKLYILPSPRKGMVEVFTTQNGLEEHLFDTTKHKAQIIVAIYNGKVIDQIDGFDVYRDFANNVEVIADTLDMETDGYSF